MGTIIRLALATTTLAAIIACSPNLLDETNTTPPVTDTDADTDADTDSDTDTDTDTDTGLPGSNCHPWFPVADFAWAREYDVTNRGKTGVETETGYGQIVTPQGNVRYQVSTSSTAGSNFTNYFACDIGKNKELHRAEWEGTLFLSVVPLLPPQATLVQGIRNPSEQMLPGPNEIGQNTEWKYSHAMTLYNTVTGGGGDIQYDGTYKDVGRGHTLNTPAANYKDALKLEYTMTEDRDSLPWPDYKGITRVAGVRYYVEGIGLVYELAEHQADSDGTGTLLEKTLTNHTGLKP
jgi:hypothetical protein